MPTRNVVLTDHHEALIHQLVGTGRYRNASEVMRDALRALEQREAQVQAALERLRGQLAPGLAQAQAGAFVEGSFEDVLDEIDRELDEVPERTG